MSDSSLPTVQPHPEKLDVSTKLAFGIGDFGTAVSANILAFFQFNFLTDVAQLSPILASSIRSIAGIWDAINDPLVGVLSDRTNTKWGRRYPWMVVGAVPLGIFFFLTWFVPRFSDNAATQETSLFWFYVIVSIFFNAAYTAVNLPYTALTPELTDDYNERTSLNQFRFTFSIGASILSLIFAYLVIANVEDPAQQFLFIGAICAIFCIIPPYICIWGTHRRIAQTQSQLGIVDAPTPPEPYWQQLRSAFSNRPFLCVIGIYFFSWIALQNTAAVIPFFVDTVMGLPDSHKATLPLAVQGTAIVLLGLWGFVSRRAGKKAAYFLGTGIWIIAQLGLVFLPPGQVGFMYLLAVLAGFGVSTTYLVPWSMLPDVIEYDELRTGQRREGIFYSFMVLLQKIGLALGQLLLGLALNVTGYDGSLAEQPPSAIWAIRLAIGPLPMVFLVLGIIVAYLYPITESVYAEILLQLRERREARSESE